MRFIYNRLMLKAFSNDRFPTAQSIGPYRINFVANQRVSYDGLNGVYTLGT
jgi:hypothetical protein